MNVLVGQLCPTVPLRLGAGKSNNTCVAHRPRLASSNTCEMGHAMGISSTFGSNVWQWEIGMAHSALLLVAWGALGSRRVLQLCAQSWRRLRVL